MQARLDPFSFLLLSNCGDQAQQCKLKHLRRGVSQDPPTLRSCIFSHLKSPVDDSNCAPAARHALGDFEDGHISIGEERYDSFYLLFTERISLSSHITEPLPTSNRHTTRLSGKSGIAHRAHLVSPF